MKKISFLFVATIATFMCLNSVYATFPKVPLLEKFTNTGCGYCASYNNSVFNAWKNANKNNLAIISYHWYFPSQADPMYQFAKNLGVTRAEHYSVNGVPTLFFEGVEIGGGQPSGPQLSNALNAELSKMVPVKITPTITVSGGTATVNVEVLSTQAMSGVRLQVLILQEQISFTTAPGSNGEKEFSFVARFALPNINGENLTLNANQAVTKQHTANLNSIPQSGRFYVVAFLETISPHSIVQTGISGFTDYIEAKPQKPVTIQVSQSAIYSKVPAGTNVTHTFTITNTSNFPIKVTTTVEQGEWTTTGLPANINIAANASETVTITANAPNTASGNSVAVGLLAEHSGTANDTNYVPAESTAFFFAMTANTKYAYLTGLGSRPETVDALNNTTHFNGELVSIPMVASILAINNMNQAQLFSDLEFLGLSFSGQSLMSALQNNQTQIASIITGIHNKGGKLYMENYENFYEVDQLKAQFPAIYSSMEQLFKNCFGTWNTNGQEFIIVNQQNQTLPLPITGVDTEISKGQSYTLNQQAPFVGYAEMINHLEPGATRVFNGPQNICAMARFEKGNARSVHSGVRIASFPVADRITIANNIVNWLFPPPPPEYTVTIGAINPAGVGTVSGHQGTFPANSSVTLTATPNNPEQYKFVNWTNANGAVVSVANPYTFTITQNITLNANFALVPADEFTVTIGGIVPEGTGTVDGLGTGTFPANSSVTLTATPNNPEQYKFDGWRNATGDLISEANPYTFTITQNVELFAHFGLVSVKDEHISLNSMFPNPAKNYLTIDLKENATVRIFTLDGVKLFEENRSEGISNINFNLPAGTYILKTETPKGSGVTKFIVE